MTAAVNTLSRPSPDFLQGGGKMGERMRAIDWTATSLGPPEEWSQSLKTVLRIMLSSRFAMWMAWGPELTFFYNDAYRPTLGVKEEGALGSRSNELWAEIWSDIGPRIDAVLKTNTATYEENLMLLLERSGYTEETYHTFSYSPLSDDDGAIVGMLCVVTEETTKVIGQRRLALLGTLAARLTGVLDEKEVFQIVVDLCGNTKTMPYAAAFVVSPDSGEIVPAIAGGEGSMEKELSRYLATVQLSPMDITALDPPPPVRERMSSGPWDLKSNEIVAVPFNQAGSALAAGYLVAGLNPYRRFDDDYKRFLELLAGQIGSSLTNVRVHEAEKKRAAALAEIDRAKTVFFSNVSHEFRTPLTLMLTPLEEVLARKQLPTQDAQLLDVAHRNSLRLLKLVNSLLDFSRIEAGRIQARYEPVDLGVITSDLASNFRSAVEKAGLALVVDVQPVTAEVYVDRDMWEKVVLNLLSNAFKFTFEGSITVKVRPAEDNKSVQVAIIDTGTGIPEAELANLFERFRRVEGARSRSYEGSGIGLALVQELVKLHGGDITVTSAPGRGSAFTISLPIGRGHLPQDRIGIRGSDEGRETRVQAYVDEAMGWLGDMHDGHPTAAQAGDPVSPIPGASDRLILLADDNGDMRRYVARLLSQAGFKVEAVADGAAALDAARRLKPDLILSDVMMPRLDGFGLLAALRAEPYLRDVPLLLLSARAGEEARVEGLRSGADDYLTKPFTAAELIARVDAQLKLAQVRKENAKYLKEEAETLDTLNKVGNAIAAEVDLERAVQVVTDAATQLSGAQFGAFFYNVTNTSGESYMLYTLSGAPREAFSKFPQPRATAVFGPTFKGEGIVRSPDITKDPRFGKNPPYNGHPKGHLPVVSYLAVPVVTQSGEVAGGLFFGHKDTGVFDERSERIVAGIATQAGIAIDKARLFRSLRDSEQTLERKVEERTTELSAAYDRLKEEVQERERAQEALRQAQKMESIGQLTGGVAHDFNNLLTVIIGNLEGLNRQIKRGQDAATLHQSVDQAMRGAKRAASLADRLLAFARRQPLDPKPIDISRLVSNMSEMLRRSLGEQISVQTILGGGVWPVMADPNQLEVALLNLAVNARDAMPDGGKLTIETANASLDDSYARTQVEVAPGQYVMIAVTDSGTGMPADVVAKAFEPFFTTKEIGQGTGLGLSQVYGFVKQSGGHVKIYSEPGEGTSVKVYLPRLMTANAVEEEEEAPSLPLAGHAETILVVEDDEDVRTYTTSIVRELGYKVLTASDGESALSVLRQNTGIDMLFTDVGLPGGMTGRILADKAREIRPNLKVLFTTGYARNAIVHDGRLDAGVQLITKPFTFEDLARKIRAVLDAGRGEGRILIVEDEALIQMMAAELVQEAGLSSDVASTATEALNKLRLRPEAYDAAIIDYGLPDRKGDELIKEIQAFRPDLPIVIASGKNFDAPPASVRQKDKVVILPKPYTQEQFVEALRALGLEVKDIS